MSPRDLPDNAAAIDTFLDSLRAIKRDETTVYRYSLILWSLADQLHPVPLLEATNADLLHWQKSISHWASGTVANKVSCVRRFYRFACRPMRWLDSSPADDLAAPRVEQGRPRPVPQADVIRAILGCADDRMRAWLILMRYAGLRCCEVAWLEVDDVVDDDEYPRLEVLGKRRKRRVIYVDRELIDMLKPFCAGRSSGRVFRWPDDGRPFTSHYISTAVSNHLHGLGLAHTAHKLRHSYGTSGVDLTGDLRLIQDMMGHSSPTTTALYVQPNRDRGAELAHRMGADLKSIIDRRRSAP